MFYRKLDESIYSLYRSKVLLKEEADAIKNTSEVMDAELFKQFDFRLTRCKTILYKDYPWFGILLSKLKTVPTNDIETMAVDNFGNIYMNPTFTMEMTEQETLGVLAHECMHIMTLSFFRQKGRDMQWWNIATDFVMNRDLVEMKMELPKGGCIPVMEQGKFWARIPGPPGQPPAFNIDITYMSAEQLYHEFEKEVEKQDKEKKKNKGKGNNSPKTYSVGDRVQSKSTGKNGTIKKAQGSAGKQILEIEWDNEVNEAIEGGIPADEVMPLLSGTIEMEPGEGGEKEGEDFALDKNAKVIMKQPPKPSKPQKDAKIKGNLRDILDKLAEEREKFDKHITSGQSQPTPLETPNNDSDYKPSTDTNAEAKLKDKVQSTITALAQRGSGAGGPRSLTKKIFETKTNWKNLLRNFLSGMEKSRPTWMKPKKRAFAAGYYAPGLRKEYTQLDIIVALDTSGSISENTMALFASEIINIVKAYPKVKIKIILWHSHVYGDIDLDAAKSSPKQITDALHNLPYQAGGTELSSVKDYLDQKYPNKKFNGLVVFTDGHIEESPRLIDTKNKLFLIIEGGSKKVLEKYGPVHEIDVHN